MDCQNECFRIYRLTSDGGVISDALVAVFFDRNLAFDFVEYQCTLGFLFGVFDISGVRIL